MKSKDAVRSLAALAHDTRLRAYRLLVQAGERGFAVGEIGRRLNLPGATLNSHLNALRRAGLVRDTREGRSIRCRADYVRMNELLAYLTENCCGGNTASCVPAFARGSGKRP
jgi:ArsR family transcriptional regulator, arsenate/arsenite/antimonite-responsive transcriptional repressor